jgi:hypothetical protein
MTRREVSTEFCSDPHEIKPCDCYVIARTKTASEQLSYYIDFAGTAGWIRTTDLLIHRRVVARAAQVSVAAKA